MNVHRIALFILILQASVIIVTAANIPLKCTSDNSACIYFSASTVNSQTIQNIISDQVDEKEYTSTQVETDITTDLYTSTALTLEKITSITFFAIFGVYTMIVFFFGRSAVIVAIAGTLQTVVYYFYIRSIVSVIKEGKGDI